MGVKSIYNLELHESLWEKVGGRIRITRVPGGWIYTHVGNTDGIVFIPFSNEFEPAHMKLMQREKEILKAQLEEMKKDREKGEF